MGQQAALQGGQLGLNAAQLAQRGALQGGQLGLQGQQALAQMAGQRADLARAGGQLGLQFGQLGQADVSQLAALAGAQQQDAQGLGALQRLGDVGGAQKGEEIVDGGHVPGGLSPVSNSCSCSSRSVCGQRRLIRRDRSPAIAGAVELYIGASTGA